MLNTDYIFYNSIEDPYEDGTIENVRVAIGEREFAYGQMGISHSGLPEYQYVRLPNLAQGDGSGTILRDYDLDGNPDYKVKHKVSQYGDQSIYYVLYDKEWSKIVDFDDSKFLARTTISGVDGQGISVVFDYGEGLWKEQNMDGIPSEGDSSPRFDVMTVDNERIASNAIGNKPLLMLFFQIDCAKCIYEVEVLQQMAQKYQSDESPFRFAAIARYNSVEEVREFREENSLAVDLVADPNGELYSFFSGVQVPWVTVIDVDGLVLFNGFDFISKPKNDTFLDVFISRWQPASASP